MIDPEIGRLMDLDSPKINPIIGNGVAVEHMKRTDNYVHQIFRSAFRSSVDGFTYAGMRRATPEEEYAEITRVRGSKRTYDTARSDIYMVWTMFRHKNKDLEPRPINLPFVRRAGTLSLSASRFLISPVATDQVISIGFSDIFVRLLRDRVTFQRTLQHFMTNGEVNSAQVAWSFIHHGMRRVGVGRTAIKANSTLMHYLLCKYGFREAFRRFGNCVPEIGGAEINEDSHPSNEWIVCSSINLEKQMRPKGYPKVLPYTPSTIRLAIRKEEFTPMVKSMVAGFFYVVDYFPERVTPDVVDSTQRWYVLMGKILWNDEEHEGRLYNDIANHMVSLDSYLDEMIEKKLFQRGIVCKDIYQLFAIIIGNFNEWLLNAADKVNSMYDKELNVLYYVLFPITNAIFNLAFKLEASSKNDLSEKEVNNALMQFLKPGLIFDITSGHGEISTVNYSGDNMVLKMTTMLVPQTATNKRSGKNGDQSMANDPTKTIHVSVAEHGGYSNLPKSDPSGRARINPMTLIDPDTNVMMRNPELIELCDETQRLLQK